MLNYDKNYNGYQVAKKTGAEDADSRRTDQAGGILVSHRLPNVPPVRPLQFHA